MHNNSSFNFDNWAHTRPIVHLELLQQFCTLVFSLTFCSTPWLVCKSACKGASYVIAVKVSFSFREYPISYIFADL